MSNRPMNRKDIRHLPDASRRARLRALTVLNLMRTEGISLSAAVDRVGTTRPTVMKYAGRALEKDERGQWKAKSWDRITRLMSIPTPTGPMTVAVDDSRSAENVARYCEKFREWLTDA